MRGTKNGWTLLLLMLAGVVIGGFIGSIASSVPGLDWLNYGQAFGLENPLVLSDHQDHDCRYYRHCTGDPYLSLDLVIIR